jgi:acyl carrier protein
MTNTEILERVRHIVAGILEQDDLTLTPSMSAADVPGWDSLANVQIFVALEKAFGLRFRTGEIVTIGDVGTLVSRIESRLPKPPSEATGVQSPGL